MLPPQSDLDALDPHDRLVFTLYRAGIHGAVAAIGAALLVLLVPLLVGVSPIPRADPLTKFLTVLAPASVVALWFALSAVIELVARWERDSCWVWWSATLFLQTLFVVGLYATERYLEGLYAQTFSFGNPAESFAFYHVLIAPLAAGYAIAATRDVRPPRAQQEPLAIDHFHDQPGDLAVVTLVSLLPSTAILVFATNASLPMVLAYLAFFCNLGSFASYRLRRLGDTLHRLHAPLTTTRDPLSHLPAPGDAAHRRCEIGPEAHTQQRFLERWLGSRRGDHGAPNP